VAAAAAVLVLKGRLYPVEVSSSQVELPAAHGATVVLAEVQDAEAEGLAPVPTVPVGPEVMVPLEVG